MDRPWALQRTFRRQLLSLKRNPDERRLNGLIHLLKDICDLDPSTWLIPIPSWKRRAGNPLPALIAKGLGRPLALGCFAVAQASVSII